MGRTHYVRLPKTFVEDRVERGLSCGETTDYGRQVLCVCDTTTLEDILDDANYQAWGTDASPRSIVDSARRAANRLRAYASEQGLGF